MNFYTKKAKPLFGEEKCLNPECKKKLKDFELVLSNGYCYRCKKTIHLLKAKTK